MTTRRRRPPAPPPPRGRSGRFGLLPPLAIGHSKVLSLRDCGFAGVACSISVKALQLRPDVDLLPQDAGEHATFGRALEAPQAVTRVGASARLAPTGHEHSVACGEPEQFGLRRAPAAAGAAPQRCRSYDSSSGGSPVGSTGIPAGTSSGSASSASADTGGSSASTSAGSGTGGVESGSASVASAVTPAASASSSCASGSSATASASSASAGGAPAT